MKKILFCIIVVFTVILFNQPSFSDWWLHAHYRGYPMWVSDIAWIDANTLIVGGQDLDDSDAYVRRIKVLSSSYTVEWTRRVADNNRVSAISTPTPDDMTPVSSDPFYFIYGLRYTHRHSDRYLWLRYTENGDIRNQFSWWDHDVSGIRSISNPADHRPNQFYVGLGNGWIDYWKIGEFGNNTATKLSNWRSSWRDPIYDLEVDIHLYVADGDRNADKHRGLGNITHAYGNHGERVNAVTHVGGLVISGSDDNTIRIYDESSRNLIDSFTASNGAINSLAATRNLKNNEVLLASCGDGNSVRLWRIKSGKKIEMRYSFGTEDDVTVVKFSPGAYYLAAGTLKGLYIFKTNEAGVALFRGHAVAAPSKAPQETELLTNYPNPFNPETWIPYQLATPAEVTVSIHAADGKLVRTLELGHMPAGVYHSKSRAAYWDGRNAQGERVASGVYFYTLKAGDFSATKKMIIRK